MSDPKVEPALRRLWDLLASTPALRDEAHELLSVVRSRLAEVEAERDEHLENVRLAIQRLGEANALVAQLREALRHLLLTHTPAAQGCSECDHAAALRQAKRWSGG